MPNPPKKSVPPPPSRRPAPRSASRRKRERRREEALRALTHPHRRSRRRWIWNGAGAVVIAAAVIVLVLLLRSPSAGQPPTSTPTPGTTPTSGSLLLAPVGTLTGAAVDGIQCQSTEQVVYHIHAHVTVYVNGVARLIPEGVGIKPPRQEVSTSEGPYVLGGTCFYWLHTHTNDGIIHIESPSQQTYTLGQFFDIWGQPLTTTQAGPATGALTVYVNGQRYTGDPRAITLTAHELIQLDVGADFPPQAFSFPVGL
jgi:hypothetical protein